MQMILGLVFILFFYYFTTFFFYFFSNLLTRSQGQYRNERYQDMNCFIET